MNKGNSVHFRKPPVPQTLATDKCGYKVATYHQNILLILILLLDQIHNYNVTAKFVSQPTRRTLHVIAKYRCAIPRLYIII